ncbi:MAG: DUF2974 domain-containing protein [Lachnospiraceae bacterium]|nr:DUF2974 domain-containing protein [Lachnospiraceae bacterium]
MSDTILDYLEKFGDKPFDRLPFGEVDALILAQFSYLKFDGLIPGPDESDSFIPIKALKKNKDFAKLFSDTRYEKVNRELFTRMVAGKRFGTLSMTHYVNIVDRERDIQFSAITFKLPGGTGFVAFRGTDENMVGWKEDFDLSIKDRIPGEKEAVGYLKTASGLLSGSFYVGGHSKGGLLSVYASSLVPDPIKKRIISIYSFDGPAVREEFRDKIGYESIRARIVKRVPQSSLVGMLFETDNIYEVVKSTGIGVGQHDPYTWVVKDIDLEHLKSLKKTAVILNTALMQWLSGMDMKDRARFIDIVFGVADACDSSDLVTMGLTPVKSIRQMMDGYEGMDDREKEFFRTVLGALIKDTGKQTRTEVHAGWNEFVEGVDKWIESKQKKLGMIETLNRRSAENGTDS